VTSSGSGWIEQPENRNAAKIAANVRTRMPGSQIENESCNLRMVLSCDPIFCGILATVAMK
jgi:hypothetical protein